MGFDAVMISPIIQNIDGRVSYGEAYHGYWPLDLYSLNSHFGTSQDLLDLSNALHSRGMYLLMDTVINNMAYITNGSDPATHIDYSVFKPFDNANYFHPYCKITNWENFTDAQLCQTGDLEVALPDLFTEHYDVEQFMESWAKDTMEKYSIDGLRIDAAKHVNPGFLSNFGNAVDTFMTGEVLESEVDIICDYQTNYIGSLPNYPIYFAMLKAFTEGNTSLLVNTVEVMKLACPDVTALVSFSENHDVQRIANMTEDISLAKNIVTFTLLFDGVPMIYQGQEQHFNGSGTPWNREALWLSGYNTGTELYKLIATMNGIRKHACTLNADYVDTKTHSIFWSGSEMAFSKGVEGRQLIMLLNNQGIQGKPYTLTLPVTYNAGIEVTDVVSCQTYWVNNLGQLLVDMDKGEPRVFFPTQLMGGSGLCGYSSQNISYAELVTGHSLGAKTKGGARQTLLLALFLGLLGNL
ncbi:alpha-amylase [Penicillium canariense]|uniref:alpha-amylase n=1 Tax=Penicillium canariense TaxID=189055 RepID=A0A9W9I4Q3_9EURO|nr:alpha-amylase [Penicillium canariense]KAJ5167850.1 alpha-amylase [Penicillium canariense]